MNIKQAEQLSGVSKRNIRFYEQEGLINPTRNRENDYREYTDADIETLKRIRVLRMVDMPLEQIKAVLRGQAELKDAAAAQKSRLEEKARELDTAIRFCMEFGELQDIESMDTDAVLTRMEVPQNKPGLFTQWIDDYKKVATAEHNRTFTFVPETPVTTAKEFTLALCQYGSENGLNLVITKEGMYPEFTVDGIEYTAERLYMSLRGIPVATIRCTAMHPEDFENDVPEPRKGLLRFLHRNWLLIPFVILILFICRDYLTHWEGWLIIASMAALVAVMLYFHNLYYYNHGGKPDKKKK